MYSVANPKRRKNRMALRLCTGLLAVSVAGCAGLTPVGPDYRVPDVTVPAQWQESVSPTLTDVAIFEIDPLQNPANWWLELNDVDLNWFIAAALAQDLSIERAQARLQQVRANRTQAVSALYPTINAKVAATPTFYGAPEAERPDTTQYDAGFDASWEVDIFGGTRRSIEAAEADLQASQADLANVQVSVIAEVAQNYVDVRNFQQRLAIARLNLASQAETLQIAKWRYQAGLARQTDVAQSIASLEQTRASIPDLEIELARAKNRLAVLTGRVPGAVNDRLAIVKPLPVVPARVATGVPANVLTQRPDLRVAERNLAAETARVGQTMAQRYPSLNLGASLGWTAFNLTGLGVSDTLIGVLFGTLSGTLFDGGRLRSQVQAQTSVQEQALIQYEQAVLRALEDVENALIAHAFSRQRSQALSESTVAAESAAQQSRELYQAGLIDFEQVLITERSQLNAQESFAQSQATQLVTLIQLYKALGGGWQDTAVMMATPTKDTQSP